jgi:hypothetical protein
LEFITTNLEAPKIRREYLGGKEFVVARGTIIVPGVLPGSQGALYYPADECARNAFAWDHIPITVYHPMMNGVGVSARDPDVLDKQGVGFIRDTTMNGKLGSEFWFDVDRTRRIDNRVLAMLEKGQKIELSTGLYTDNEPAGMNASFNGHGYEAVARNYRPDHIAILPDQIGACSIQAGCGINNSRTVARNQVGGGSDEQSSRAKIIDGPGKGKNMTEHLGIANGPIEDLKQRIADLEDEQDEEEAEELEEALEALTGNDERQNCRNEDDCPCPKCQALREVKGPVAQANAGFGQVDAMTTNPASWVEDEDTWEKAKEAAGKSYDDGEDAYWP